jgi:metal-responsive CopG/Arc/MetJ family transcriptional regulator
MARKQVIVQLDSELVAELDGQAKQARASRSEIIRRACRMFLDSLQEAEWDREYAEAYRRIPEDPHETEALTRLAAENWPE